MLKPQHPRFTYDNKLYVAYKLICHVTRIISLHSTYTSVKISSSIFLKYCLYIFMQDFGFYFSRESNMCIERNDNAVLCLFCMIWSLQIFAFIPYLVSLIKASFNYCLLNSDFAYWSSPCENKKVVFSERCAYSP